MSSENLLLELTPSGMQIVESLRRTPDEPPASVVRRALALLRAVQKYMEDDSLVVIDPYGPLDDELVQLRFAPQQH